MAPPRHQEYTMRKAVLLVSVVFAGLGLAACNTVEGAGKDVSSVGKATTEAAKDVKN